MEADISKADAFANKAEAEGEPEELKCRRKEMQELRDDKAQLRDEKAQLINEELQLINEEARKEFLQQGTTLFSPLKISMGWVRLAPKLQQSCFQAQWGRGIAGPPVAPHWLVYHRPVSKKQDMAATHPLASVRAAQSMLARPDVRLLPHAHALTVLAVPA